MWPPVLLRGLRSSQRFNLARTLVLLIPMGIAFHLWTMCCAVLWATRQPGLRIRPVIEDVQDRAPLYWAMFRNPYNWEVFGPIPTAQPLNSGWTTSPMHLDLVYFVVLWLLFSGAAHLLIGWSKPDTRLPTRHLLRTLVFGVPGVLIAAGTVNLIAALVDDYILAGRIISLPLAIYLVWWWRTVRIRYFGLRQHATKIAVLAVALGLMGYMLVVLWIDFGRGTLQSSP